MGFFGSSRGSKRSEDDTETQTSELMNDNYDQEQGMDEEAQEVMAENLDLMKDIVMQIREDPDFASTIYQDCPRLQHLLDDRPDLRPIFEDPYLVQINFEQVYRAAGGKLPEDEEQEDRLGCVKKALVKFVNSPFFKFIRAILLIKKIYMCATGNSIASLRNMLTRCGCEHIGCCAPDAPDASDAANQLDNPNADDYVGNPQNEALRASLYAAADHMQDPEVAEQMSDLLDNDPDGLQEAIENDPDLRALRDSSPLCAELMSDPDTMRVLVDPDNLRALGDCPDLIEQDFADPNWTPPDVETGGYDPSQGAVIHTGGVEHLDTGAPDTNADVTTPDAQSAQPAIIDTDGDGITDDVDADVDGDGIDNAEDADADGDAVPDSEEAPPEYELGDKEDGGGNNNSNAKAGGSKSKQQQNQQGGGGGFFSQVTAGLTDMIAGEIVGTSYGDIMGGGDDLGGLDSAADQAADSADQASSAADNMGTVAAAASMGDQIDAVGTQMDQLESGMDKIEEAAEDADAPDANDAQTSAASQPTAGQIAGATAENVIIFGPCLMPGDKKEEGATAKSLHVDEPKVEMEEEEEGDVAEKKKRFGFIGNFASAVGGAAKETLLGAVLGSDLAEWAAEKEEEREAAKEEKDQEKKSKDKR